MVCVKFLIMYALAPPLVAAAFDPACGAPTGSPKQTTVQHVIDGDTVVLEGGARLRLIGIDAPELGHDKKPDQPWAGAARDYLKLLLERQAALSIVYDREHRDKYRRSLGHLFLPDGTNIQAQLLARGLALPLTVPPNLAYLDCYRQGAEKAIAARSGIWSQPQYQPRPATAFTGVERGYHVVRGAVSRVGNSRSSVWLNLGPTLAIRIVRNDLQYFANLDIAKLAGQAIEARGVIYHRNRQLRLRIRHAADIRVLKLVQENRQ